MKTKEFTKENAIKEQEYFSQFVGKKVEIQHKTQLDWSTLQGKMKGKILEHPSKNGQYIFMKSRATRSFYYLTLGLFDGFSGVINVKDIKIIN